MKNTMSNKVSKGVRNNVSKMGEEQCFKKCEEQGGIRKEEQSVK